jgi:hypothetical protein
MAHFEDAVRFGGTVLAHAAWIASDLEDGALVCPFAIIQTGGEREVIAFESDSQAESIELGKASFQDYKERVEFWSFAREGLLSYVGSDGPKVDVLTVSVWGQGLDEPLMLRQRFNSNAKGGFKLVGPIEAIVAERRISATVGILRYGSAKNSRYFAAGVINVGSTPNTRGFWRVYGSFSTEGASDDRLYRLN